jgi:hypothetical protein
MIQSEAELFEEDLDKILRWYKDETGRVKLTPKLEERLNRWKMAREYILTFSPPTDRETVRFLMKSFQISEPMAYKDVRNTKRLFASMETVDKEFDRIMLIASVKKHIDRLLATGRESQVTSCYALLARLGGYDKPTEGANEGGGSLILNVQFNPKLLGAKEIPNLEATVQKFIGDRAKEELMLQVDDIDWIDVKNEESDDDGPAAA